LLELTGRPVTLLHPVNHPNHPAPVQDMPHRDCPRCGRVSGYNLSTHCCLCGEPYKDDVKDQQRDPSHRQEM
jgi:ribosomal protein L37E